MLSRLRRLLPPCQGASQLCGSGRGWCPQPLCACIQFLKPNWHAFCQCKLQQSEPYQRHCRCKRPYFAAKRNVCRDQQFFFEVPITERVNRWIMGSCRKKSLPVVASYSTPTAIRRCAFPLCFSLRCSKAAALGSAPVMGSDDFGTGLNKRLIRKAECLWSLLLPKPVSWE